VAALYFGFTADAVPGEYAKAGVAEAATNPAVTTAAPSRCFQ
jgi:hypothetical protein